MKDFAMCPDDGCPSRRTCDRHEASGATVDPICQVYTFFERPDNGDRCDFYIPKNK